MQWSPLIIHQEVVEDEVNDVDQRAVALDAPQKPDRPAHPSRWHRRGRGFGGLLFQSSVRAEDRNGEA